MVSGEWQLLPALHGGMWFYYMACTRCPETQAVSPGICLEMWFFVEGWNYTYSLWNEDWAYSQYEDRQCKSLLALVPVLCQKLGNLTFSFCSTAEDRHLESTSHVPSSRHSWAWLVTSEEISNESSSPIWHLPTQFPSLGLSACLVVFRDRWFVLAWLLLFTYALFIVSRCLFTFGTKYHYEDELLKDSGCLFRFKY